MSRLDCMIIVAISKNIFLLNEKVICYNFNPYLKHNIEKPDDVVIIDMEFIRFRHY